MLKPNADWIFDYFVTSHYTQDPPVRTTLAHHPDFPLQIQSVASQPNSASTMLVTHRSDMWAAGVVILEMYVGGLAALRAGRGENAHTLLETLIQNSDRNSDNQQGIWIEDDRGSAALMPECCGTTNDTPGGGVEVGRNTGEHDSRGDGKARQKGECFRVAMPGDVRELLREIFKRDERERPMSVQVGYAK